MNGQRRAQLAVALALVWLGAGARLFPHPANFAPVGAVAIFGGAVLPRRLGLAAPLAALMLSDIVLGFYTIMPVVWACYGAIALGSSWWLRRATVRRTVVYALAASLFFFVITNGAVWLWSGMYLHSWAGLLRCYALALPFWRNTLLSDGLYTSLLFGVYLLAGHVLRARSTQEQTA